MRRVSSRSAGLVAKDLKFDPNELIEVSNEESSLSGMAKNAANSIVTEEFSSSLSN